MTERRAKSPEPEAQSLTARLIVLAVSVLSMGAGAPPVVEAVKDGKIDAVRALFARHVDPNDAGE